MLLIASYTEMMSYLFGTGAKASPLCWPPLLTTVWEMNGILVSTSSPS